MDGAIGTLVDVATEQARHAARQASKETARLGDSVVGHASDLAQETARRAGGVAEALSPSAIPAAIVRSKRRGRRRDRAKNRENRRGIGTRVFVLAAFGVVIAVAIQRARARQQRMIDAAAGPSPDAFGAAVIAEREAAVDMTRPVPTPGA